MKQKDYKHEIYTWLVKTLHNVLLSFALPLVLFLPSWLLLYIDFGAVSFSVSPTVGCIQYSTLQNAYVDAAALSSASSIVKKRRSSLSSIVHGTHELLSVHVSANECKLTFLNVTDTYVRTYIAGIKRGIDP